MPYGTIVMENGTEILVEIGDTEPYRGLLSERNVVDGLKENFDKIMILIEETAKSAHARYMKIPEELRPKEFELCFGLKI
jgi:hypothetical protein